MWFFSSKTRRNPRSRLPRRTTPLGVECLEDRCVPSAGALDPTFGSGGLVTTDLGHPDYSYGMALQADGKVVMAGTTGTTMQLAVVRYNSNGSLDNTFSGDGIDVRKITGFLARDVAVQPVDGKILVAGDSNGDIALVRYNANGTLDTGFGTNGVVKTDISGYVDYGTGIAIQADGKIVVSGQAQGTIAVVRYNPNGSLDTAFNGNGLVRTSYWTDDTRETDVTIQADGKIVVVGSSGFYTDFTVLRFNPDGNLDPTFGGGSGVVQTSFGSYDQGQSVAIQSWDGKIVVAGVAEPEGDQPVLGLVRYNTDGSLDTAFGADGVLVTNIPHSRHNGASRPPASLALQQDGRIVVSAYAYVNGDVGTLVRFNPDGSFDLSFDGDGKASLPASRPSAGIAVQADQNILVAGHIVFKNGNKTNTDFWLARYQTGGNTDPGTPPVVSVANTSVAEGNSGQTALTFTVTLSWASSEPVTVHYATANGTATAGSDYQAASGTLVFAPGETVKTITIWVYGDTTVEPEETFDLILFDPAWDEIARALATILNDDSSPGGGKGGPKK